MGETGHLRRELLKHVVREGVEDGHGLPGDAQVPVHLLDDLEDVGLERLLPGLLPSLLPFGLGLHAFRGLLGWLPLRRRLRQLLLDLWDFGGGGLLPFAFRGRGHGE